MEFVWVVETGSKHEGGGVDSVHPSFDSAMNRIVAIMDKEFTYWENARMEDRKEGKEISEFDATFGVYQPEPDNNEEYTYWSEASNYVSIRKMGVGHVPSF